MQKGRFKKRPLTVEAVVATENGYVDERGQKIPVYPGDWLVTDENGKTYCLPDSDFRRVYEPVDAPAKKLLENT